MRVRLWLFFLGFSSLYSQPITPLDCQYLTIYQTIKWALSNNNEVKVLKADINRQWGETRQTMSPFDPLFEANYIDARSPQWSQFRIPGYKAYNTEWDVGVVQKTRTGTEVKTLLNFTTKPSSLFGNSPIGHIDTLRLQIEVTQPLLRGFMRGSDRMEELASFRLWRATRFDSLHQISEEIAKIVNTYWGAVATNLFLDIQIEAVDRYKKLVGATKKMIKRERIARSEIYQPLAELARQKRERDLARQNYYVAVQNLNLAMGFVDHQYIFQLDALKLESFPDRLDVMKRYNQHLLVKLGLNQRLDLKAAQERVSRSKYLVQGAENQKLPQVDLFGTLNEPLKTDLHADDRKLNDWAFGAKISIPFFNDQAIGQVIQQQSILNQSNFEQRQIFLEIEAGVIQSLNNHYILMRQVKEAELAATYFREALESEIGRFKEGFSSLFLLTEFENRLTRAETSLVETKLEFAKNLVDIRFQTGMLMTYEEECDSLSISDVKKVPNS